MTTSLHPVFNVVFGNVSFVIVVSNIRGRKIRISLRSQSSIAEKRFLVILRSFSQRIDFSQGAGGYFLLISLKESFLEDELSSWFQKNIFNLPQNY